MPISGHELELAFMLTDQFLPREKLAEASHLISIGQRIELPPKIRTAVLAAIQDARTQRARDQKRQGKKLLRWGIYVGIAALLFLIFHPWPHYQWSLFLETVSSYETFVNRFPSSAYADSVKERLRVLREPDVWSQAKKADQIESLREYVRIYPDGEHLDEARERIAELADTQWEHISGSRSVTEIREFLRNYPETSKAAAVEARVQELFNDWDWVREQDSLVHYQQFAALHPSHPELRWIEKRIIDLEVKEISAGMYGELPSAQPLSSDGSTVEIEVKNQTGYELTVMYSGSDSKKIVIPRGGTRSVSLPPGDYQIAASLKLAIARSYYGTDTMRSGKYATRFYLEYK